jgi:hypothetical protein
MKRFWLSRRGIGAVALFAACAGFIASYIWLVKRDPDRVSAIRTYDAIKPQMTRKEVIELLHDAPDESSQYERKLGAYYWTLFGRFELYVIFDHNDRMIRKSISEKYKGNSPTWLRASNRMSYSETGS